jgi:hypothetical protein
MPILDNDTDTVDVDVACEEGSETLRHQSGPAATRRV